MPVHLLALDKPAKPASSSALSATDSALRSAVVKVANYYLRMAQSKSPAEMEAIIWGIDSVDGVDHGESCAAFASLTLALGAQATGQESWVTGGTTYPWPLRQWADVRVDPNPASPQIISVLQDAQAHDRWHPIGDGYQPQPGDWVMFDGHVEVVTRYSAGALYTIGGDSSPNLSVNAHTFTGSLAAQGVTGFVNNGELPSAAGQAAGGNTAGGSASTGDTTQAETAGILAQGQADPAPPKAGGAAVPGTGTAALTASTARAARRAGGWDGGADRDGRERYDQDGGHSRPSGKRRHPEHGGDAGHDGRRRRGHGQCRDGWHRRGEHRPRGWQRNGAGRGRIRELLANRIAGADGFPGADGRIDPGR